MVTEYGYDAASRLTTLTYRKGATALGNLTYEYDTAGRRTKVGGSLARTGLPQSLSSASYNDGNRQTAFGSQTLTYDDSGNLTSDGTNTYAWNARNQLFGTSGPGLTASFTYDAAGRRASKTINGATTSFLYSGANMVQDQVGGSASANNLTGGTDQFFSRTDASGTVTPLRDALGSVVALTDASGAIQTTYTYEPFGKTRMSGTTNSNTQKYTGREDDGTGLYYYRNRYYSPAMQRFISEDPIGLAGGINLYAYVHNNPISFRDPSGLQAENYYLDVHPVPAIGGRQKKEVSEGLSALGGALDTVLLFPAKHLHKLFQDYPECMMVGPCGLSMGPIGAAGAELVITEEGLAVVESHVATFGEVEYNTMMMDRIRAANAAGRTLSGADANFFLHEFTFPPFNSALSFHLASTASKTL